MQLENTNSQALFEVTGARKIVQMKQICQENSLDMGVLEAALQIAAEINYKEGIAFYISFGATGVVSNLKQAPLVCAVRGGEVGETDMFIKAYCVRLLLTSLGAGMLAAQIFDEALACTVEREYVHIWEVLLDSLAVPERDAAVRRLVSTTATNGYHHQLVNIVNAYAKFYHVIPQEWPEAQPVTEVEMSQWFQQPTVVTPSLPLEVSTLVYTDPELDALFCCARWCADDAAAVWLRRCAQLNCPVALACMALLLHQGCRTFRMDPELANHLGHRAITSNLEIFAVDRAFAQYFLGELVYHGVGTPADKAKGLHRIGDAAQKNVASAQYALGSHHEHHGNVVAALKFYQRATSHGHTQGFLRAGLLLVSSGEAARHQEGVQGVFNAASMGNVMAIRCLGQFHQQLGHEDEALRLYAMAAHHSRGDAVAPYLIGLIHEAHHDAQLAAEMFSVSADRGYDVAQVKFAMYNYYRLFDDNVNEGWISDEDAVRYLQLAVAQHNREAFYRLGNCLLFGRGIQRSLKDAISMYRQVAAHHDCARIKLAFLLTAEPHVEQAVVDEVLELWTLIVQSLQPHALGNRPTLAIILPSAGVVPTCSAPFSCRLHFLDIASFTLTPDFIEIVADLQFVITAAPVFEAGLTFVRLAQLRHNVPVPPHYAEMIHFLLDPSSTRECNYEGFAYTETCEATLQEAYRAIEARLG